ncbi:hypothetical protein M8J76_006912 [Diaphorina citri]|nr:hypothetical protein M8J76_006912 [Diaphorina citri]
MKFFIVFAATVACVLAEGVIYSSGYLADSPDVAAAKLAHFEEKAKAAAAVGEAPDYVTSYYLNYYKNLGSQYAPAAISVLPSGYLADTPEVAAAKSAHFAEYAKAAYAAGASSPVPAAVPVQVAVPVAYNNDYNRAINYATPFAYNQAVITVLPNGYLADTPEVAAAKVAHAAEHARAAYYI